jgi:hypothetical protein
LAELVAFMGEMRIEVIVPLRKPKGMQPLGKVRYRWEDNIKMDLREIRCAQS